MHLLRVPEAPEPVPTYYGGPTHGPVENAARKRVERQMSTLHPSIICSHSELQRQTSLRFSPLQRTTSPFMMLSQRRACRLSPGPLVPTRCHEHRLRFSGRTYSADILWTPRARPFGALCILDSACSFVVCKLGSCCVHSSAPQPEFDRSLREGGYRPDNTPTPGQASSVRA